MDTKGFFSQFEIILNVIASFFPIHLHTYVIGLRSLEIFYSYSAGIHFRRQVLTFKVDPRTVRVNFSQDASLQASVKKLLRWRIERGENIYVIMPLECTITSRFF